MPYRLTWEPRGVYRQYLGDVTIRQRLASFEDICGHPRFDEMRYCITDYLDVEHYETTTQATHEIAALHIAPLMTNPKVLIAAVAVRPDVLAAIQDFIALQFTRQPYRIFSSVHAARLWIGHDALSAEPPPGR